MPVLFLDCCEYMEAQGGPSVGKDAYIQSTERIQCEYVCADEDANDATTRVSFY